MLPLKHPFTALVVGPTCCGKMQFVFKLKAPLLRIVDRPSDIKGIGHRIIMIDPPPNRIVYVYVPKNERANETVSVHAEKNTQNVREGEARVREKM